MPFRRVACGVSDKGKLVPVSEVESFIRSQTKKANKDWYVSAYTYPDTIQEYWKANGNSISGYTGEAWSDCLYWDLDYKKDLEVARTETLKLVDFLISKGLQDGLEVYFSGQKGFHVLLKTEEHFHNPVDLARICSGIVKEAGIKVSFDTVVYNITRIFRYPNTVHQETSLLKIPIDYDELQTSADYIRELAEVSRLEGWETEPPVPVKVTGFVEPYLNEEHRTVEATAETELSSIAYLTRDYTRTRRCQEALERGEFGPGERDNAITRMAAYYRGMGFSEDDAYQKISHALELRAHLYPDAADYSDDETSFKVSHVYGPTWKGGMYSCETDEFLANKCSIDGVPCAHDRKMPKIIGKGVVKTGGLLKSYIEYGEDSAAEYPKFGIQALDEELRVRPKNFSIIAGAAGTGKTSLILEMIESLNQQKIPHLFFSMDMSDISLFEKLAAKFTNYTSKQIEKAFSKHHRDPVMIEEIAKVLSARLPFTYFDFTSTVTMKHIETTISKLNKDLGADPVKVVFIDYAGRIVGGGDNAYANASANALMANDVAKNTNTHLMFIAQVSRESGDHTTPLRSSRVAKESGAWEENATFVLTVWRPFGDGIDAIDHYMAIYVAKNRSGSLKEFHFYWEGKTGTIRDMTIEEFNEYVRLCEQHDKGPVPNHPAGHIAQSINKGGGGKANRASKDRVVMKKKDPLEEARENSHDTYHPEEELPSPGPSERRQSSFKARSRPEY